MAKQVQTWYQIMPEAANTDALLVIHQGQFPGNVLGVIPRTDGKKVVKVAYPIGSPNLGNSPAWMDRQELDADVIANPGLYNIESLS